MRLLTCSLAALLAMTILHAAPLTPNLVPDPSFEARDSWSLTTWENCEFKSEYVADAHGGKTGVHLLTIKPGKDNRISAMAISKPFAVSGGQDYLLALWYKTGAGDRSAAAVSILSYKQPFATAQFKTPQTGYTTLSLPASATWRLWTCRYRMPEDAVEAIVAPRLNAIGEAWVDQVSIVPADQARIALDAACGQISSLPDTRRYAGKIDAPAGVGLELSVYGREGDGQVVKIKGGAFDLQQAVPAGQALPAVLTDPASGAVYATADLPTPPLVQFSMTSPSYRRSVFSTCRPEHVGGILRINASPDLLKQAKYAFAVGEEGKTPRLPTPKPALTSQTLFAPCPPSTAAAEKMAITVQVSLGGQTVSLSEPFTILPAAPTGTHEVVAEPDRMLIDGKPFFPRGFMGGNPTAYEPVAKAGYNVGMTFSDTVESATKFLDGCQALGMHVITGLPDKYVTTQDTEGLRQAIRKVRNHPALLGYYFPDEPSPSRPGSSPEDFAACYKVMREEDPYHPVMTTLCEPELSDEYENCLDILLYDPYPVVKTPRPLTMVSDWLLRGRELTGNRKPIWLVPQTFGGDVIQNCPASYSWLTPSPEQERAMIYLGLAAGASGLLPYCYHVYTGYDPALKDQGKWPWLLGGYLPEKQPALWGSLVAIGKELELLSPALCRPSRCWSEQGLFLREMPPSEKGPGYLIAVNPSEQKPIEAVVKLHTRLLGLAKLEYIDRSISSARMAGGDVTLSLQPMQVGIYLLPAK